jgi:dynein heavy chain
VWVWISGILNVGNVFKRLDGGDGSYRMELQSDPAIQMLLAQVNQHFHMAEVKSNRYRRQFSKYEYLWNADLHEIFRQFLTTAIKKEEIKPPEPTETEGEEGADGAGSADVALDADDAKPIEYRETLDLAMFDEKIKQYLHVQSEIEGLRHIHDMDFLRINGQPIKQAMGTWVTKWMYLYTGYIQKYISEQVSWPPPCPTSSCLARPC